MFSIMHNIVRRMALYISLLLVFVCCLPVGVKAASASDVETYVDEAVPSSEGYGVNQPLRAGDISLAKPSNGSDIEKIRRRLQPPELPVGNVAAPQISSSSATSQLIAPSTSSSASVMMMQGMRIILQKAGQNPDLPKAAPSAVAPIAPVIPGSKNNEILATATAAPISIVSNPASRTDTGSANAAQKYQPGQEPHNLASVAGGTAKESNDAEVKTPAAPDESSNGKETSVFGAPVISDDEDEEDNADIGAGNAPLSPAPSLASAVPAVSSYAAVDDNTKEVTAAVAPVEQSSAPVQPEPAVKQEPKPCVASVASWTKTCEDAGYPAAYAGSISGETRTVCPGGEVQDVWLSNTCALPDAAKAKKEEKKTVIAEKKKENILALPESEAKPEQQPSVAEVEANCGAANGMMLDSKPASDLCSSGVASDVTGAGPWNWSCKGSGSSSVVSCAALVSMSSTKAEASAVPSKSIVKEDGVCGSANDVVVESSPASGLCSKGIASVVNGAGPWFWACSGINGGSAVSCSAPKEINGACGAANGVAMDTMPRSDLCASGYASAVNGAGPWHWICSGLHGGDAAACSVPLKQNATCGAASLSGHRDAPKDALCNSGASGDISGTGPWYWTCAGENGGASVTCSAKVVVDGVCGEANGKPSAKVPSDGLCSSGAVTTITGSGPWNWGCLGADGGNTVSCTSPLEEKKVAAPVVTPVPADKKPVVEAPAKNAEVAPAPAAAAVAPVSKADVVSATTKASTPEDAISNMAAIAEKASPVVGACGKAAATVSSKAPASGLCASGTPTDVSGDKTSGWNWSCLGASGGAVSCSTPSTANVLKAPVGQAATAPVPAPAPVIAVEKEKEAACGAASGQNYTSAPKDALCSYGKSGTVRGEGPWTWTCEGKSGTKAECTAYMKAEGVCGDSNGTVRLSAPADGLCTKGSSTPVSGEGPWVWSCLGSGGGTSVSCSAGVQVQSKVDGVCGKSVNAVLGAAPSVDLCDSGRPSAVHGSGPWTWTCSGLNGGSASVCTNTKVVVEPPSPPVDANCGSANGVAALDKPLEGLCSSGIATEINGDGPWNWNCLGSNGGMSVSCTAPLMPPAPIDGVCGAANGVSVLTMPRSSLCASGISSAVSGAGPWTWSCSGVNGGGAVSCVAPLGGSSAAVSKPLPSVVMPASKPVKSAPPTPVTAKKTGFLEVPSSYQQSQATGLVTPDLASGSGVPSKTPELPANMEPLVPPASVAATASNAVHNAAPVAGQLGYSSKLVIDDDTASVSFDEESDQLDDRAKETADKLAAKLIASPNSRITLIAGASIGEGSPRDARRLSLNRALALRDYLAGKGVPSNRVDVRALGANVRGGDPDRIDVKVN